MALGNWKNHTKISFQMVSGLRYKYMTSQLWNMNDDDNITFSLTVKWRLTALYNACYFHSKLQIIHYQPKCHLEPLQDKMEILNRLQIYVLLLHRNFTVRRHLYNAIFLLKGSLQSTSRTDCTSLQSIRTCPVKYAILTVTRIFD